MKLARELKLPIAQVEKFSGREMDEWEAHFQRHPFTWHLIDMIGAQLACLLSSGKHRIEDFLVIKTPRKTQSDEEKMAVIASL